MAHKVYETKIHAPVEALWEFHRSADALRRLTPPDKKVEILGDTEVRDGARHTLLIRIGPIHLTWIALLSDVNPPHGFVDVAEKSPFASWRHHHEFIRDGENSILRDTVDFKAPFGPLGRIAELLFIAKDIDRMFAYRHQVTKESIEKAQSARL